MICEYRVTLHLYWFDKIGLDQKAIRFAKVRLG